MNGEVFLNYHSFRTAAQAQKYMTQKFYEFFLWAVLVFSKVVLSESRAPKKDSTQSKQCCIRFDIIMCTRILFQKRSNTDLPRLAKLTFSFIALTTAFWLHFQFLGLVASPKYFRLYRHF